MSDQPVGSTTKLRVVGPNADSFTYGDTTVTSAGTEIPAEQVQELMDAARGAGAELEEI